MHIGIYIVSVYSSCYVYVAVMVPLGKTKRKVISVLSVNLLTNRAL